MGWGRAVTFLPTPYKPQCFHQCRASPPVALPWHSLESLHPSPSLLHSLFYSTTPPLHFCNTLHGGCDWSAHFICACSSMFWIKILQLKPQCFLWFWSMFLLAFDSNSFIIYSLTMPSAVSQTTINRLSSWKFSKCARLSFVQYVLPTHPILICSHGVLSSRKDVGWGQFSMPPVRGGHSFCIFKVSNMSVKSQTVLHLTGGRMPSSWTQPSWHAGSIDTSTLQTDPSEFIAVIPWIILTTLQDWFSMLYLDNKTDCWSK